MPGRQQPRAHCVAAGAEDPWAPQRGHLLVQMAQARQAAAEHDHVRVQQVDHRGQRLRQPPGVAVQRGAAGGVALRGTLRDLLAGQRLAGDVLVVARQARAADQRLDAAALAAVAVEDRVAPGLGPGQRVVPPFARQPVRPLQDATVHGNAGPGAGAQDGGEDDCCTRAGTVGGFGKCQAIGVVGQHHRLPAGDLQVGLQRHAVEAGGIAVLHQP